MQISHRIVGSVYILCVSGSLVIGETKTINQYIEKTFKQEEYKAMLLNLEEVKHFDSSGLGFIAGLFKKLRESEVPLLLSNLNPVNQKIYKGTGMDEYIPFYPTEQSALDILK